MYAGYISNLHTALEPVRYFDTVGWVFWPVKTVSHITYTVLVETLNHAQSINLCVTEVNLNLNKCTT